MAQDSRVEGDATSTLSRRRFCGWGVGLGLAAGASLVGSATGCSVGDPRIIGPTATDRTGPPGQSGGPPRTPEPTSGPTLAPTADPTFAGAAEGAETERRLAGWAAAVLDGPWRRQLAARKSLIAGIRSAHLDHAAALEGPQPTARPTGSPDPIPPAVRPSSLAAAVDRLVEAELDAATRHRAAALATTGYSALVWGSMSVAAASYASALTGGRPVQVRRSARRPMPQLPDVEAMQLLVKQLHAVVWGYQLAIGQLADGTRRASAVARLRDHRIQLDWLTTTLVARSAAVPAAEPAYVPSVNARSDATAAQLVAAMEDALAPFCGLWLAAAATVPDRRRALSALSRSVTTARRFGAPVTDWPGWS